MSGLTTSFHRHEEGVEIRDKTGVYVPSDILGEDVMRATLKVHRHLNSINEISGNKTEGGVRSSKSNMSVTLVNENIVSKEVRDVVVFIDVLTIRDRNFDW